MKKRLLKFVLISFGIVIVLIAVFFYRNEYDVQNISFRTKQDELPTIKPGWEGNAVDQKDRFINDEFPFLPKTRQLIR